MKLRFSLRMLLVCTVAVAALAAFVALRMQPARVASQFQAAVQRGDWEAATAMIVGNDLKLTLDQPKANSWKIESFEFSPQSSDQWLRGECLGKLVVTLHSSGESEDAVWSTSLTTQCDVVITTRGVQIMSFFKEEPVVAGAPKPPYESDASVQPASD